MSLVHMHPCSCVCVGEKVRARLCVDTRTMMAVAMVAVAVGRSPCMAEQRSINPVSPMPFASTNLP
jgi:hypothetical protein